MSFQDISGSNLMRKLYVLFSIHDVTDFVVCFINYRGKLEQVRDYQVPKNVLLSRISYIYSVKR